MRTGEARTGTVRTGAVRTGAVRTGVVQTAGTAVVVLVVAACGADSQAGFGMPTQTAVGGVPGERTEVGGVLRVEVNGCFTLELDDGSRRWVVWPDGFEHDGEGVVLARSFRALDGDRLVGEGLLVDAAALPDWENPDSYAHAFGTFCEAGDLGVVAFDEVATA